MVLQALALIVLALMFLSPSGKFYEASTLSNMGKILPSADMGGAATRGIMRKLRRKVAVD